MPVDDLDALDRLARLLQRALHDDGYRRRLSGRLRPALKGRPGARSRLRLPCRPDRQARPRLNNRSTETETPARRACAASTSAP